MASSDEAMKYLVYLTYKSKSRNKVIRKIKNVLKELVVTVEKEIANEISVSL